MSKKPALIDLANLDTTVACDKAVEIELKHPATNAPIGVFISVLGRESTAFREYLRDQVNENLRRSYRAKGKADEIPTVEKGEEKSVEAAIVCTAGWRTGDKPTLMFKGEELTFNVPNARTVYAALPWIRQQVDEAIGDLELFMKG